MLRGKTISAINGVGKLTIASVFALGLVACQGEFDMSSFTNALGSASAESGSTDGTASSTSSSSGMAALSLEASPDAIRQQDIVLANDYKTTSYPYDLDLAGGLPASFKLSNAPSGAPSAWAVEENALATSPSNVVAQRSAATEKNYTALLLEDTPMKSKLEISSRVYVLPEGETQAAGIAFSAMKGDVDNCYVALIDAKNQKVTVERVVNSRGLEIKKPSKTVLGQVMSATTTVKADTWYSLKAKLNTRRDGFTEIQIFVNDVPVINVEDNTYQDIGLAGIVTKGDSTALFDTFTTNQPRPKPEIVKEDRCVERIEMDFNAFAEGAQADGFVSVKTGDGSIGSWQVVANNEKNPRMVKQVSNERNGGRLPVYLYDQKVFSDFEVRADVRTKSGEQDNRAAGLVFRYQDPDNYYFYEINTRQDEVRLWRVVRGERQSMQSKKLDVKNENWYKVEVRVEDILINCYLDNKLQFSIEDNVFMDGKVGMITKSDTVAEFDDFRICSYR